MISSLLQSIKQKLIFSLFSRNFWVVILAASQNTLADSSKEAAIKQVQDELTSSQVGTVSALVNKFRQQQVSYREIMPPDSVFKLRQPCGMFTFDPKTFPASFNNGLIGETLYGCPVYTLIIIEDPITREVVIANADGKEIYSVGADPGYNPYWYLSKVYPDLYSGYFLNTEIQEMIAACDPANIQITFQLLPEDFINDYAKAVVDEQVKLAEEQAAAELKNPSLKKGSISLMRYQSSGMTDLEIVAIDRMTNGMKLRLAYPNDYTNRVDFFSCADLMGFWWDLASSSNSVSGSTNFIDWVDTSAGSQTLRFYHAGNAELDTDGDGLTDAKEKLMYHTNSSTNDTDGDGLSDYNEVITLNTDPNNNDTNKPNVVITSPVVWSRKVWMP